MNKLYYPVLVLLLLISKHIRLTFAHRQLHSISAILKSYDNAFITSKPDVRYYYFTTPINRYYNYDSYDFTTVRPAKQQVPIVPTHSSGELKTADSTVLENNSNDYSTYSGEESEESQESEEPPDHIIPHSEHENPREPSTRPNYTAPGEWAKPPSDKNIPLDFVPTKLYAQVRGTHTVKHVPREEAIESAETEEEKENAAKLREVVKLSKANTIYTEEGYEDAAYDHAGHIRDADFDEEFARKLEKDSSKTKGGGNKRAKKPKRIKNASLESEEYNNDHGDHVTESIQEARSLKKLVKPENINTLKSALNKSIIDPKSIAEEGILRLEEDLKQESREAEKVPTDPYTTQISSTFTIPVTETVDEHKVDNEITTTRPHVHTVRPRKSTTTVRSKTYLARKYNPLSKRNENTNLHPNNRRNGILTPINKQQAWQPSLNKQDQITTITYPIYTESHTANPLIASPLAVATLNGHGPYIAFVTSAPNAFTPNPLKNQETTINYNTIPTKSINNSASINSYITQKPYLVLERRKTEASNEYVSEDPYTANNYETSASKDIKHNINKEDFKFPKLKSSIKNNLGYLTVMQPPKISNDIVAHPKYLHESQNKMFQQAPIEFENEELTKNTYKVTEDEFPFNKLDAYRSAVPVTELLPPAPLSRSEYMSFLMRGRRSGPTLPPMTAIVPIIQAIHEHKNKKKIFPFLFRRKRSTLTYSKEGQKNFQLNKKLHGSALHEIKNINAAKNENTVSNKTYPVHFEVLLNESPNIAGKVVNKEIEQRFKNDSKSSSKEVAEYNLKKVDNAASARVSNEKSNEVLNKESDETKEEIIEDGIDESEENTVQVEIPELDFNDVFEEEDEDFTTKKTDIDTVKYPFYKNKDMEYTALKYIINPMDVPRKTLGGMEFYNSRNLECEDAEPNLEEIVPENEELEEKRGPQKSKPRLYGLGDKLDCFKAKYFDENPLDNPIFSEKNIEMPSPPPELNPREFASRILKLPLENDKYVSPRGPKFLETYGLTRRVSSKNTTKQYIPLQRNNHKYFIRSKKPHSIQSNHQRNRPLPLPIGVILNNKNKIQSNKTLSKQKFKTINFNVSPSYQHQVYEDVMGTIKNLRKMPEFKKASVPTKMLAPAQHKVNLQRHNKKENIELNVSNKQRPVNIANLVPPPKYALNYMPYKFYNKLKYLNRKNHRYHLNKIPMPNSRIFKRNINVSDSKELEKLSDQSNYTINEEDKKQMPFRIVLSTPISENIKQKRKTLVTPLSEFTNQTSTRKSNNLIKYPNRNSEDLGKYDKFSNSKHHNSSSDSRRNEPRYNNSQHRIMTSTINTTASNFTKSELPKTTLQSNTALNISDSTLIPVIIKPDEKLKTQILQESQIQYAKLNNSANDESKNEANFNDDVENNTEEQNVKNSKNQYLVHENIQEDSKNRKNDTVVSDLTIKPSNDEPQELSNHETTESGENENSKSTESTKDQKVKDHYSNEDQSDEQNESTETYIDGSSSEDAEVETQEKDGSEEDNSSKEKSDDKSFERFSDRPYSPPENYEDEKYSDLGPRVNKPYFYHPPFEAPKYESYTSGKAVDHFNDDHDDDWSNSEETKKSEKYKLPWENDEDEEESDETENYSSLGRYESPWEKRNRRNKERRKRERLRKKHGKIYDTDDDEHSKEATNMKLTYVPLKNKHLQDEKDVKANSQRHSASKFSSKYKRKIPLKNDKKLFSTANANKIEQSTKNYLEKANVSSPITTLQNNVLNKTQTTNNNTMNKHSPGKLQNNISNETTTVLPIDNFTTLKSLKTNTTIIAPLALNITKYPTRTRVRKNKDTINSNNNSNNATMLTRVNEHQITSTPFSTRVQRRGRTRNNFNTITTTSTTSPTKSYNRRRSRPVTSTIRPASSTILSVANARQRRPVQSIGVTKSRRLLKTSQRNLTPLPSVSTPTEKTIEHHSHISKKQIITKTFYPDEDEGDTDDDDTEENPSNRDNIKAESNDKPNRGEVIHRKKLKKNSENKRPMKKEKVEKITITMEETPDHVYKMKEIDRDGVKGKFVTIIPNNSSFTSINKMNDFHAKGSDMGEIKNKLGTFKSIDSINRDSEDLVDEPSRIHLAENYLIRNLHRLPLPVSRSTVGLETNSSLSEQRSEKHDIIDNKNNNDYNRNEKYKNKHNDDNDDKDEDDDDSGENNDDNDDSEEDDEDDDEDDSDNDTDDNEDSSNDKKKIQGESDKKKNDTVKALHDIIKNPNDRQYFYVE